MSSSDDFIFVDSSSDSSAPASPRAPPRPLLAPEPRVQLTLRVPRAPWRKAGTLAISASGEFVVFGLATRLWVEPLVPQCDVQWEVAMDAAFGRIMSLRLSAWNSAWKVVVVSDSGSIAVHDARSGEQLLLVPPDERDVPVEPQSTPRVLQVKGPLACVGVGQSRVRLVRLDRGDDVWGSAVHVLSGNVAGWAGDVLLLRPVNQPIGLYDQAGECLLPLGEAASVARGAVSPCGSRLAVTVPDARIVRVFDVDKREAVEVACLADVDSISQLFVSPPELGLVVVLSLLEGFSVMEHASSTRLRSYRVRAGAEPKLLVERHVREDVSGGMLVGHLLTSWCRGFGERPVRVWDCQTGDVVAQWMRFVGLRFVYLSPGYRSLLGRTAYGNVLRFPLRPRQDAMVMLLLGDAASGRESSAHRSLFHHRLFHKAVLQHVVDFLPVLDAVS